MIELTLPATPEGKAAAREVIDALDSAQVDYEAWEEDDESVSFDFDDSDQDAVLDVMRGLGIDVEPTREDDPQSGDPMYRTEKMIEADRGLTMPTYDRMQIKSRLATMVSNLKLKLRSGELDKMADEAIANPAFAEVVMKVDPNNAQALSYIRKGLKRMGFIESDMDEKTTSSMCSKCHTWTSHVINPDGTMTCKSCGSVKEKPSYLTQCEDLIDRVLAGASVDEVVDELILGVQTPPPDIRKRKTKMGGGINPESNKATYYPMEPGSQGWFET